jgi:N-acetylneuraminic acid mutarotase
MSSILAQQAVKQHRIVRFPVGAAGKRPAHEPFSPAHHPVRILYRILYRPDADKGYVVKGNAQLALPSSFASSALCGKLGSMNILRLCRCSRILLPALVSVFAALSAAHAQESTWSTGAPMPTLRTEITAAALNGLIYVTGGLGEGWSVRAELEVYDPETDTWEARAPLPVALHHTAMAAAHGRLYVSGGYSGDFSSFQSAVYAYDPETDVWESVADLPAPRAAHAMVSIHNKLYVVGGVGPRSDELWIYDPGTKTWDTSAAPLPTPREHLAAVALDGLLYVVGGRTEAGNLGTLEVYDPEVGEWTVLTDMPTPRGGITAAAFDGQIHVTGGEAFSPSMTFDEHEIYDPATNTWATGDPMPTARHGLASVALDKRWYVIGGATLAGGDSLAGLVGLLEIFS